MRGKWSPVLLVLVLLCRMDGVAADTCAIPMVLTQGELDWIAANPVIRVGVFENLIPFEYISQDQLRGLSAKYLQLITQRTGLHFESVVTTTRSARKDMLISGDVDILSTRRRSSDPADDRGVLYTVPYNTSSTILVSRIGEQPFAGLESLAGKRLVMLGREGYSQFLEEKVPGITVISAQNAVDMMAMVKDGRADAAIASEWLLIPYLSRQYQGVLQISGVVPQLHRGVSMAVRDIDVILLSILEKALVSVTADERKAIYDAWFAEMDLDIPTIKAIADHYADELWLLLAVVLLLVLLVWQSRFQRHRAVHREREKAMFLAVMSHEIRSPMNAVLAAVELLQHTPLDKQQRHFTDLANSGSNTLLRLVDDVLDISKIEAGQFMLDPAPVDLWALIQQVVDAHQQFAREKGLGLTLTGERFDTPLLLDQLRIAQVLRNLISNAIKFTDSGQVEVQLQTLEGTAGDVSHVQIRIIDSGVGLSKQVQRSLFRRYALAKSLYKRTGGTGLGLLLSRRLVKLMQGKLRLTSTLGVGTLVDVTLPVKWASLSGSPLQEETMVAAASEAAVVGNGLKVLVIEASAANLQDLVAQLHYLGCDTLLAADAEHARALFAAHAVDMVLMSCDSPESDGYRLAGSLRELEHEQQRSGCPILAMSTCVDNEHLARCFDVGMDGLLKLPIKQAKLQQMVELWCSVVLAHEASPLFERKQEKDERHIELRKKLSSLIEAIARRDHVQASQALHQLRGMALAVGWADVMTPIDELQQIISTGKIWPGAAIAKYLDVLLEQWADFLGDIHSSQ